MHISNNAKNRVLLVSSDMYQANKLKDHIKTPLVECECVNDVETAKKILSCRRMKVLAIDSNLKKLSDNNNVKDFVNEIKSLSCDTKVVVYNGVCNRTIQRRIRRKGADGYLSHKNSIKNVAGSVRRVLD